MTDDVAACIDAIAVDRHPLIDRVHRVVVDVRPDAGVVLSYKMPTYVAGTGRLYVGVRKPSRVTLTWTAARALRGCRSARRSRDQ